MEHPFDRVVSALASGLTRRGALKALTVASGGVLAGYWGRGGEFGGEPVFAQGHGAATAKSNRAISLLIQLPGGHTPVLDLRDRHPGKISFRGEDITMIPHIMDFGQVELAVYRGRQSSPILQKRVMISLGDDSIARAERTPLNLAFMPGLAVGALAAREVAAETAAEMMSGDCSVFCCWGGSASGCSVCCDSRDPSCGSCCDSGCCPACTPPA